MCETSRAICASINHFERTFFEMQTRTAGVVGCVRRATVGATKCDVSHLKITYKGKCEHFLSTERETPFLQMTS